MFAALLLASAAVHIGDGEWLRRTAWHPKTSTAWGESRSELDGMVFVTTYSADCRSRHLYLHWMFARYRGKEDVVPHVKGPVTGDEKRRILKVLCPS